MGKTVILLVRVYQIFLSPDHGLFGPLFGASRCRFYPSCSAYTVRALRQRGLLGGSVASFKRIVRCHPWSKGGYDPG